MSSNKLCNHVFDTDYAGVHDLRMAHNIPAILQKMKEVVPGKQTGLAKRLSTKGKGGLKISQPQISRWMKGQEPERPNYDRIVEVATELGIISDIRSEDVAAEIDFHKPRQRLIQTEDDKPFPDALPQMMGRMGAGSTGAVITIDVGEMQSREEVGEWWRIPPTVLRGLARSDVSRTIGFSMDGADSMEPTILRTDIVFIDTGRQEIEPDGIWALDYGLGRTLKRISIRKREGETYYVIKSDNPKYPDEEYHQDEVTVFGRFIGRFSVF